jgi:hypothetical protein
MSYRIAELLKEVANWIACDRMLADKTHNHQRDQNGPLEHKPHRCCHSAPHGALFNISSALLTARLFLGRSAYFSFS